MRDFSDVIKSMIFNGLENVIGRYYSTYRAFVYSNDDPDNLNRLQLLVPHVNPRVADETWAYPRNTYSGNGYGVHLLPKKGDMVWVEYEYGNLDYPVWSFGHFGENQKPEEFTDSNTIGFKTPNGTLILFNDIKGEESISIRLAGYADTIEIALDQMTMESKLIKLGTGAEQWAAKGESTQAKIEEIWTVINQLGTALATHGHGGNGASAPFTTAQFSSIASNANTSKSKVKEILSEKNKIE